MGSELHVEGILHLNALSLIVTIAYLGLDRVHLEQDAFLEAMERAGDKARAFVRRCDIVPGQQAEPASMFYRFPFWVKLKFYALCQIAGVNWDIEMGNGWRILHCCHRQRYVPLFGYFNKRRDRTWVSILAAVLLVTFLYTTAAAVWELEYFPADFWTWLHWLTVGSVMTLTYWICLVVLLWIFFSVGITYVLQHIELISDRLQDAIDAHMKIIAADVARNAVGNAAIIGAGENQHSN